MLPMIGVDVRRVPVLREDMHQEDHGEVLGVNALVGRNEQSHL